MVNGCREIFSILISLQISIYNIYVSWVFLTPIKDCLLDILKISLAFFSFSFFKTKR